MRDLAERLQAAHAITATVIANISRPPTHATGWSRICTIAASTSTRW
jgi:hypothetical protein